MRKLTYNSIDYKIDNFDFQKLSNNTEVRHFGIQKITSISPKFLKNTYKYHWRYYFNEKHNDKILNFYLETDFFDKVIEKKYY